MNSYFNGQNYQISGNGGAINVMDFNNLLISNCKFSNFRSLMGGSIYFESRNFLMTNNAIIKQNYFYNNCALSNGGGIYVLNIKTLIIDENIFDSNSAINPVFSPSNLDNKLIISGGAIYYDCSIEVNCSMTFINTNKIINNFSSGSGAGISWITFEPIFFSQNYNSNSNTSQFILFNNNTVY